ncbi:interferon-related developmental regulator 2-like [Bolinopsis microptera]|uniref:interferon-related developmental regulator 2-like n=1 Tax=Bolinopsis microptera TaxID=2820187 RepID=UPI003079023A
MGKKGGKGVSDEDFVVTKRNGRNAKGKRGKAREELETSDIEDDLSSYVSNLSYQHIDKDSIGSGSLTGESGIEDNDVLDQQLDVSLEAAALKNSVVRIKNLKIIQELLSTKIMGETLFKRKGEMLDVLIKSFKIGKGAERLTTAQLTVLYGLQCGEEVDMEDLYNEIKPFLLAAIDDGNIDAAQRAKIIFKLSVLCFLCSDNMDDRKELLLVLRDKVKQVNPDVIINSLASISLILTICTPTERRNVIQMLLPTVRDLLKNSIVEVRIEAGEMIAHIFELGRDYDEEFDDQVKDLQDLLDDLDKLQSDGAKFRAKRDRKVQRASFREIFAFVSEEGEVNEQVKISLSETLTLCSWSERVQYGGIKEILGPATSLHLQQNIFVREIFGLGAVPLRMEPVARGDKLEMKKLNAACHKARQKNMLKQRDKRMVL